VPCSGSPHADFPEYRLAEDIQLEDWTWLNGLTGLTLGCVKEGHHDSLAAVLLRMTALRSLVLADVSRPGLPAAGERCYCVSSDLTATGDRCGNWGARKPANLHVHIL
jgi:hypothetical protein